MSEMIMVVKGQWNGVIQEIVKNLSLKNLLCLKRLDGILNVPVEPVADMNMTPSVQMAQILLVFSSSFLRRHYVMGFYFFRVE